MSSLKSRLLVSVVGIPVLLWVVLAGHELLVMAVLAVLAGIALAEIKDSLNGKVYVIGTPSEEIVGAKIKMSEDGLFDDMALLPSLSR